MQAGQLRQRAAGTSMAAHGNGASTSGRSDQSPQELIKQQQFSFWDLPLSTPHDKDIFALILPALLGILVDSAVNMLDVALIGQLSTSSLGAAGLSNMVLGLGLNVFGFLMLVTTSKVAGAGALGDTSQVSHTTAQVLTLALLCAILLSGLFFAGAPWLMQVFKAEKEVAQHAIPNLRIRSLGVPAVCLAFVVIGSFRGLKDTRTPLLGTLASGAVNTVLHLLFMRVLGWGIMGAAWATVVGQWAGTAVVFERLMRRGLLEMRHLASLPTMPELVALVRSGISLSICSFAVLPAHLVATTAVTALGPVALAAHTIIRQLWDFLFLLFTSLNVSTQSLVAAAIGRGDDKTVLEVVIRSLQIGAVLGSTVGALLMLLRESVSHIFTSDPAVLTAASMVLPMIAMYMPLLPTANVLEGRLIGALETGWVAVRTVVGAGLSLGALLAVARWHSGLSAIWAGLLLFNFCTLLGDTYRLWSGSAAKTMAQKL